MARAGMAGEQGSPLGQQGSWAQLLWRLINGLRRRIREQKQPKVFQGRGRGRGGVEPPIGFAERK